ncbi:EF-hand domain-containing protein [Sphingomonas tabacisoli]|uniref:EF-hand domain-containing protein n=1 Tax=Sphingomonas tabacisoli TaxID=2249466 RepID=A0ABW4I5B4_9SPHN
MKKILLGSAIVIAAPALAQTTAAPTASTNAAQPAAAATPAATAQQPTTAATPAAAATPSAAPAAAATPGASTAATATSNPADAVAAVVSADWSKYDASGKGQLTKAEFGKWMEALREQNPAQKAAVKDATAWTNAAFAKADKDKSGSVSKTELEAFLKS